MMKHYGYTMYTNSSPNSTMNMPYFPLLRGVLSVVGSRYCLCGHRNDCPADGLSFQVNPMPGAGTGFALNYNIWNRLIYKPLGVYRGLKQNTLHVRYHKVFNKNVPPFQHSSDFNCYVTLCTSLTVWAEAL